VARDGAPPAPRLAVVQIETGTFDSAPAVAAAATLLDAGAPAAGSPASGVSPVFTFGASQSSPASPFTFARPSGSPLSPLLSPSSDEPHAAQMAESADKMPAGAHAGAHAAPKLGPKQPPSAAPAPAEWRSRIPCVSVPADLAKELLH